MRDDQVEAIMTFRAITNAIDKRVLIVEQVNALTELNEMLNMFESITRQLNYLRRGYEVLQSTDRIRALLEAEVRKKKAKVEKFHVSEPYGYKP
jgi:hypothetical protein